MLAMSLNRETQEALCCLGVKELPDDWVQGIWDGNFCESASLPLQAEEDLLREEGWRRAVQACRHWTGAAREQEDEEEEGGGVTGGFWTTILEAEVSHKSLLALLYCILERQKQRQVDRTAAVCAAQLYLTLLQIPGSSAFKMFHPMVFQKALDAFYMFPDDDMALRPKRRASVVSRGRRGRKRRHQVEEEEEEESLMEVGEGVAQEDREVIKKLLKQLIEDLHGFLCSQSLSDQEVSRYQLVQVLLRMTKAEVATAPAQLPSLTGKQQTSSRPSAPPLYLSAWLCLDVLCRPLQGPIERTCSEVFQQLLPSLLMLLADGGAHSGSSLPSSLTNPHHHALGFVSHVSEQYGQQVATPLKTLVQHLCTKVPDRAEYRSKVAVAVVKLLSLFPDQLYSQLLDWLYKLSRNTKIPYRMFALDVVSELLAHPLRPPGKHSEGGALSGDDEYRMTYRFLIKIFMSRCSDKSPSVRSRALVVLSAAASDSKPGLVAAVKKAILSQTAIDPLVATPLPSSSSQLPQNVIVPMVRRRTSDLKVGVRKAALQALEAIVRMDMDNIAREDVEVIQERCLDPAVSIRKQALSSLTSITLDRPQSAMLHSLWLEGTLPMVTDRETGVQEKCMALLDEVILSNITSLKKSVGDSHAFIWRLLSAIAQEEKQDLRRYLCRAMEYWARQGRLTAALVRDVCSHTSSEEHLMAAWMLLAEMSLFTTTIEMKILLDSWHQYSSSATMTTPSPLVQILVVIGNMAGSLSKVAMEDVKADIISLLESFQLSPSVIHAAVNTACQICRALTTTTTLQSSLNTWCVPLLRTCEAYLSTLLQSPGTSTDLNEEEAMRYIFTLGEVAQLCPAHTSQHLCLMVQSLLLATATPTDHTSSSLSSSQLSKLSGISQLTLSSSLRAHGYITLGKLCLQNEDLTKKSILLMARELEHSTDATIRNNIIVVLCDLAVRYSTKVDPYIPNISSCLRDESLLVRKQTLTLLAHLLQEDYIKWKGSLFFRFVSTLVDPELHNFAEFCLVHLLLSRYPTMFYQHFIECIFHFNSYEKHRVYNRFRQSDRERKLFSLKGAKDAGKRMAIYTFLLSHMADEHRFQLAAKLCQEVLGGLVDGAMPLDEDSASVVRDTLAVLTSREMKLSSLRRNVGEELADEGDHVGAAVATAQTKIISQIVKRNVIENVVPIVVSAKHLLEKERSPLLKDLLGYLKELMQDYKNEVSEILAADPQLAEEIKFDLKRFEEEQKRAGQLATPMGVVTPHGQMISPLLSPGVLGSPARGGASVLTPPRLRKETPRRQFTPATRGATVLGARVRLGVSPLVHVQRIQPPLRPPPIATTTITTPAARLTTAVSQTSHAGAGTQTPGHGGVGDQAELDSVSSPASARKMAAMVNSEYAASISTPAVPMKTPRIPLQRAVLLKSTQKLPSTPLAQQRVPTANETIVPIGRAASTPEGLAECISFNVSSVIPPSPIPANLSVQSYSRTRSQTRQKVTEQEAGKGRKTRGPQVDILMLSPEAEPRRLEKWKVTVK